MEPTPAPEDVSRRRLEALVPAALLVLRLCFAGRQPFYLDWMVIVSVYWILYVFFSRTRAMAGITAGAVVALFAVYMVRAFPHMLDTINLNR